jgi:hypothetical protein
MFDLHIKILARGGQDKLNFIKGVFLLVIQFIFLQSMYIFENIEFFLEMLQTPYICCVYLLWFIDKSLDGNG